VLFSKESVAHFINESFEPTWQSVRPVPIVRIDFGNGNVLTRTLHGNILTSVCTPDGLLVDALPGIYTEAAYRKCLQDLLLVAQNVQHEPAGRRDAFAFGYHHSQITALQAKKLPARLADLSKTVVIEAPIMAAVQTNNTATAAQQASQPPEEKENPAGWKALEEDTRINERSRRIQIHQMLARTGLVKPDKVTHPIYKDILHADLDDPYLGLGDVLFSSYPFAKEDAVH
jgi:hypothetical protein